MDRTKETIMNVFKEKEEKYKEVFEIIDKRWKCQLHRPLLAAGHYLNPEYLYSYTDSNIYGEAVNGLFETMERLVSSAIEQDKITTQLSIYRNAKGLFERNVTIRHRRALSPTEWWECYKANTPELQKFAIKVLSLTCSASGCERNWSVFEQLYVNDSNEWLMDKMDGESDNEEDELVFEGDDLTWDAVARASGDEEPAYCTRGKNIASMTSSSHARPTQPRWHDGDGAGAATAWATAVATTTVGGDDE
ncbi:uncharacterized protein LOC122037575 [Zingiber officinale]|uniref:uncharacterized protein LOC122037575 n=1 Tax=Zingiber officinale TaxID=94328 RepID=UPI001C4CCE59|nr:uncharacterized protein LOC122037575 [Zingiber officinale]